MAKQVSWAIEIEILALALIILFVVCTLDNQKNEIDQLKEEIKSMPHYECYEETILDVIHINETDMCIGHGSFENNYYEYDCLYNNSMYQCDKELELCFLNDKKEVCEIK